MGSWGSAALSRGLELREGKQWKWLPGLREGVAFETSLGECEGRRDRKLSCLGASLSSSAKWGQSVGAGLSDMLYFMCV